MNAFYGDRGARWRHHWRARETLRARVARLLIQRRSREAADLLRRILRRPRVAALFFSAYGANSTPLDLVSFRGQVPKREVRELLCMMRPYLSAAGEERLTVARRLLQRPWWWWLGNRLRLVRPKPNPVAAQPAAEAMSQLCSMFGLEYRDGEVIRRGTVRGDCSAHQAQDQSVEE